MKRWPASAFPNRARDRRGLHQTTARKDGDDYVINGGKMWITNSLQADWMCLLANTSEGASHRNQDPHLRAHEDEGHHDREEDPQDRHDVVRHGLIHFRRRACRSATASAGGMGFTYQMLQFQEERLWGAASGMGSMARNPAETVDYVRERKMFGQTVLDFQVVQYKLAEIKTDIEALRALVIAPPTST